MTSKEFYDRWPRINRPRASAICHEHGKTVHAFFCDHPEAFVTMLPTTVETRTLLEWLGYARHNKF